ncbi:MAG: hypothetical protein ACOX4G_11345 [Limnochordia bacterium]|jgi:phosphomannomutase
MIRLLREALEDSRLVQSFSGVRTVFGLGPDISPELTALSGAYAYCYAAHLPHNGEITLLLGRDPRPTGESVARALSCGFVAGARKAGYRLTLIDLGIITTPLAETAVRALAVDGGVIITASHNPIADNGFKFLTGCGPSINGSAPPGALLSASGMSRVIDAVRELARGDGQLWQEHMEQASVQAVEASLKVVNNETARVKVERAYLDMMGADWGLAPHCLKPLTLGPVLVDPNGGAGCGIGARVLEHFGVRAIEVNAEVGYPEHGIDTDGIDPASGRHMLLRVSRAAARQGCHFGVAFDYDADRGNLVLPGYDEGAIIEPQRVAAFNVALVLSRRSLEKKQGCARGPLAIVASDATSLATHRVARAFGAEVFVVETGEINVVSKMYALREAGYDVPVGVEGANGGTIFESATCRDGLQVALSAAQAESVPDIVTEWLTARRHIADDTPSVPTQPGSVLPALLASIPVNHNVALKLTAPALPQGEFKRGLEACFVKMAWPVLESHFDSYEFQNFEGLHMVPERTGDESGAWRVYLQAVDRDAFVFVRGSRTEAGVWRMIIDAEDAGDFAALEPAARAMFAAAGAIGQADAGVGKSVS